MSVNECLDLCVIRANDEYSVLFAVLHLAEFYIQRDQRAVKQSCVDHVFTDKTDILFEKFLLDRMLDFHIFHKTMKKQKVPETWI